MPKRVSSLDDISVSTPCSAEWDSMVGNDHARFCSHCNLSVHDLSAMTQREALRLVASSKGRLCVRYYRRPDRSIQTANLPQRLHQITRRTSRIAAGAFTAALSLSMNAATAVARTPSSRDVPLSASYSMAAKAGSLTQDTQGSSAALTGTVLDPVGAVVAGAKVILTNEQSQVETETTSSEEGVYQFDSLEPGSYTLRVNAPGFTQFESRDIVLQSGAQAQVNATLQVGQVGTFTMGLVAIAEPSEPLVKAAYDNELAAVKELLASGADADVIDKGTDSTALAQAAAHDNRKMIRVLLDGGADVNRQNRNGETALMYMNENASADTIRDLIKAGADLELKDDDGETALISASRLDNTGALKALISAGAKLEAKDEKGQTALMHAAREGIINNVKALLEAGAQINRKDEDDWTALRHAREGDHEEVIKLLQDKGAIE